MNAPVVNKKDTVKTYCILKRRGVYMSAVNEIVRLEGSTNGRLIISRFAAAWICGGELQINTRISGRGIRN